MQGMQLPQAQEVLAGLMSLASVQSPALPGGPEAPNKGLPQAWRDSQKMAPIVREASGSTLKQNLGGKLSCMTECMHIERSSWSKC